MMRLLMILISPFLVSGCSEAVTPPSDSPALFCDVEEKRVFSQEEIDWRTANAPWNLKRDFKTNLAIERECAR